MSEFNTTSVGKQLRQGKHIELLQLIKLILLLNSKVIQQLSPLGKCPLGTTLGSVRTIHSLYNNHPHRSQVTNPVAKFMKNISSKPNI